MLIRQTLASYDAINNVIVYDLHVQRYMENTCIILLCECVHLLSYFEYLSEQRFIPQGTNQVLPSCISRDVI